MPCSASRFVSMYRAEMSGRNISSADTYTKGRGVILSMLGGVDRKVSQTLRAVLNESIYDKVLRMYKPESLLSNS